MYIREVRLELDIHELRKLEATLEHTGSNHLVVKDCLKLIKKLLEASNQ